MTKQTEALKLALEALYSLAAMNYTTQQMKINAIADIKEALSQPEQEPAATISIWREGSTHRIDNRFADRVLDWPDGEYKLYIEAPQRKPLSDWIDPNDKTQKQYLPNISEPVLFCHEGKTYYGKHTGGSFQYGAGVTKRYFDTWECRWMPIPAAHGIKE